MKTGLKVMLMAMSLTLSFNAFGAGKTFPDVQKVEEKSEFRPHIGILGGVFIPEGDHNTSSEYGVDIGFQPLIPFGLGLEFTTSYLQNDNARDLNRNNLLVKGTYNFGGDTVVIKESYVGLGVGPSFNNYGTRFVVAPLIGFDIPVCHHAGKALSVGAQAKYMIYDMTNTDGLALNVMLKYWF